MKLHFPRYFASRFAQVTTCVALAVTACANLAIAETHIVFWQFSTRDADVAAWKNAITQFERLTPKSRLIWRSSHGRINSNGWGQKRGRVYTKDKRTSILPSD
jgi:hypothetical protein